MWGKERELMVITILPPLFSYTPTLVFFPNKIHLKKKINRGMRVNISNLLFLSSHLSPQTNEFFYTSTFQSPNQTP